MAQPQPENRESISEVLRLVDRLSADEREELYLKLDLKSWGERWRTLCDKVEATRIEKGLPLLTEEEIVAEMKAVRREVQAERAESGH